MYKAKHGGWTEPRFHFFFFSLWSSRVVQPDATAVRTQGYRWQKRRERKMLVAYVASVEEGRRGFRGHVSTIPQGESARTEVRTEA